MFNEAAITLKGMRLNSKVQAGTTKMKFTKVRMGDGVHKDDEILENSLELVNKRQEIPISHISLLEENTVKLTVIAENKEINQGFYISEMGVYAEDPDDGEILYSIATGVAGKMAYHPSCTEMADYSLTIDVYIQVSNTKDIVIEIQKDAVASAMELERIKEDIENLKNPDLEGTLANLIVRVNNNVKQLEKNINDDMDEMKRNAESSAKELEKTNEEVSQLKNPVFDDSGNVEGITNFITFMDTFKSKVSIFDFIRNLKAGLQFVIHTGKIINDSMTTESGFVADARQLNPKLEGTLANLVAENVSAIAQLNSDIVGTPIDVTVNNKWLGNIAVAGYLRAGWVHITGVATTGISHIIGMDALLSVAAHKPRNTERGLCYIDTIGVTYCDMAIDGVCHVSIPQTLTAGITIRFSISYPSV